MSEGLIEGIGLTIKEERNADGMVIDLVNENGKSLGFAMFSYPDQDGICVLEKIYVSADFGRGRGHGSRLINKVFDLARSEGARGIIGRFLPENVGDNPEKARKFYERHGFLINSGVFYSKIYKFQPINFNFWFIVFEQL